MSNLKNSDSFRLFQIFGTLDQFIGMYRVSCLLSLPAASSQRTSQHRTTHLIQCVITQVIESRDKSQDCGADDNGAEAVRVSALVRQFNL